MSNFVEWGIEQYDAEGGFTSTTICIETCTSNPGSNRRSSKKSTSSVCRKRKRRMREQLLVFNSEDDLPHVLRTARNSSSAGKAHCTVKTPFISGSAGAPYNKKLRKKNMQQQQQRHNFSLHTARRSAAGGVTAIGADAGSFFYISPTHRVVAETTAPGDQTSSLFAGRYHFFDHGGLPSRSASAVLQRGPCCGDDDDRPLSANTIALDLAMVGGGSRRLAPIRAPSFLPPVQFLPATKAEISGGVLEECFLETHLSDDFSLL